MQALTKGARKETQPVCNGARPHKLRVCVEAFAFRRLFKRRAVDTIGTWLRAARPRNWRDQGDVDGRPGALPEAQSIRQYLDAAALAKGTSTFMSVKRRWLQLVHQLRSRTRCAALTQGIEHTSTPARSRNRLNNTTRKQELHSRNSGAVGNVVRASFARVWARCVPPMSTAALAMTLARLYPMAMYAAIYLR